MSALRTLLALAAKDLRLLVRDRGRLFFALGFPLLFAPLVGLIFGGAAGDGGTLAVALVDEARTPAAAALVARLRSEAALALAPATRPEAEAGIRAGDRVAAIVIPAGYGAAPEQVFRGQPLRLELLVDPSRRAEAAMLEGVLTGAAYATFQGLLADPAVVARTLAEVRATAAADTTGTLAPFLGALRDYLDAHGPPAPAAGGAGGFQPVAIARRAVEARADRPRSAFDFSFPQGILWGVIGCALSFAQSLVAERTSGTLTRLQVAPLPRSHVLAGKALACFAALLGVELALLALGAGLGLRASSWPLLAAAAISLAACFVGIMTAVAAASRTEAAAAGLGWGALLPMSMIGGGMVPLFFLPGWLQAIGVVSPVRWGILALEGAIWRGFGPGQLALPCAVLLGIGAAGFALGVRFFRSLP
jgi:ABC-2 type transport system permease protein